MAAPGLLDAGRTISSYASAVVIRGARGDEGFRHRLARSPTVADAWNNALNGTRPSMR